MKKVSVALALVLTVGVFAPPAAHAAPPDFASGFGITVSGTQQVTARQFIVDIATPNVAASAIRGPHQVRVLLPDSYDPSRRYPVLYLLHGGADARSDQWVEGGGVAEQITAGAPVITVLPEGGRVGWYTDWVDPGPHTQRWPQFHLDQLVPWIDANLSTVAAKRGRAIADCRWAASARSTTLRAGRTCSRTRRASPVRSIWVMLAFARW